MQAPADAAVFRKRGKRSISTQHPPEIESDGLLLRDQADALPGDLLSLVREASLAQAAVAALPDIARHLLRSTSVSLYEAAMRKIVDVVPGAQRISVVGWPPDVEAGLKNLVPECVLLEEGIPASPISLTLARRAVESRQALYYAETHEPAPVQRSPSIVAHRIRSAVYVPLLSAGGEVLGLLCVDSPLPSAPILPRDFHFIRAVGALLSASLEAERLREEARQRELEARRQEAMREAMAAFLGIASHDLKGPLTVVELATSVLRRSPDHAQRDELLRDIYTAGQRARRLIDNYLVASQVDAGQPLSVERREVDPHRLVADEIRFLRAVHGSRLDGLEIVNELTEDPVSADPDKLSQIVANLLSNAVKYTPLTGRIHVASERTDGWITFRIADTGPGISADDRPRLFQKFQRVGDRRAAVGTGLGLWVTRLLVEAHGGAVGVGSEPGQGACFWFRLPDA